MKILLHTHFFFCTFFGTVLSARYSLDDACRRIAANVGAASRRRGVHKGSGGR